MDRLINRRGNLRLSLFVLSAVILTVTACNGRLIYERVVTATPNPNIVEITVTPGDNANPPVGAATGTGASVAAIITATPNAGQVVVTNTQSPANTTVLSSPNPTGTLVPVPTLSAYPTDTRADLYIAQQDFEHGYMFWISTSKAIWVLIMPNGTKNATSGEWRIYQDTWDDKADPENDPNLTVPSGLYQPIRGFGKVWRNTQGLRDALGWAVTPEFDLTTKYVYQPGGSLDAGGKYVQGPGQHFITTLDRKVFKMIEPQAGQPARWERIN